MTHLSVAPAVSGAQRGALAGLVLVDMAAAAAVASLPFQGRLPVWICLAALAATALVVLLRLAPYHPYARFGIGNGITLVRAGGAAVFLALALEPRLVAGPDGWLALAAAAALFALDALDGWSARRQGLASAFGARFDMETDALLILALAGLAAGLGKAGPWVLCLGLIRYGFVLAGLVLPALARPLPPSRRRRAVCGLQVATLGLLLAPPVVPPLSAGLAAVAFAALVWSFAVDIHWLLRRAP